MTLTQIVTDPLLLAGVVSVVGFFGARYRRGRRSVKHFLIRLLLFTLFTGLMLVGGVVPYEPGVMVGNRLQRLLAGSLEVVWWLAAAWLAVGFLRAFVVLSRQPRESKLVQDLLAALIYLAATFAIVAHVFDLPVRGLLATSGALAIIIGLALQSSLGDVFSGIVLNIERPYRVGDWVILDDGMQGSVIETNWRAVHILTGSQDVAIIPNSVIAKAKLINCSSPTRIHGAGIRVKLEPSLSPAAGCHLLKDVLLGSTHILRAPEPSVTIKDVSAETIDYELSYSVTDLDAVSQAQNDLFDRVYRATAAAGVRFAPRFAGLPQRSDSKEHAALGIPERLLEGISLFSTMTAPEKVALTSQMLRKEYPPGALIVKEGTVLDTLCIVSDGVLVARGEDNNGREIEVTRLAPGEYFGELALLTGEPLHARITALTRVVIYAISKDALAPLLKARPSMVEELSQSLASRRLAHRSLLDHHHHVEQHQERQSERLTATIRRLFALH